MHSPKSEGETSRHRAIHLNILGAGELDNFLMELDRTRDDRQCSNKNYT